MKKITRYLALALAAVLLMGCVSCGGPATNTDPSPGGETGSTETGGDGGTLRIAMTCAALPNTDSQPSPPRARKGIALSASSSMTRW